MLVLRQVIGETLRGLRMRQRRTLREVSTTARVSLGYLSEVERGQKEASSELLAAICRALDVEMSELFWEVSDALRRQENRALVGRVAAIPGTGGPRLGAGLASSGPSPSGSAGRGAGSAVRASVAA